MESRIFSEQILDWSKLLEKQDVVKIHIWANSSYDQ